MKVKDIVNKCRLNDTQFIFLENGKEIDRKLLMRITEEYPLINRTVNTWEVKDNNMIIWVKPL